MFKNYVVTAFRNLFRHKALAFIYFGSLAVGLAVGTLILIWVHYQFSFDNNTSQAKDIYRVYPKILINGNNFTSSMAPPPLSGLLTREFPEVIATARVWKYNSSSVGLESIGEGQKIYNEEVYQADSTFFQVFGYSMLQGKANESLAKPNSVVITRSTAIKYFGEEAFKNDAVVGKSLLLNIMGWKLTCKITGVSEDVPVNAHFHYKVIFSNITDPWYNSQVWVDNTYYTYALLRKGTDARALENKLVAAVKPHIDPQLQANFGTGYDALKTKGGYWEYKLQPVTDIHLHSDFERELEPGQSIGNVYILGAAAIFLLIMSCINYANLATANSIRRSKEIGVRKTLGSSRLKLMALVFTETGIISFVSWIMAFLLIIILFRPFQNMMRTELPRAVFFDPANWAIFIGLLIMTTFFGGVYPAFHLSSFNAVKAIKGKMKPGKQVLSFKGTLLVTQFVMFIGLIICAVFVNRQLNFLHDRSPGFNKDNVVILSDPGVQISKSADAFIADLKKDPKILSVNLCADYPNSGNDNFPISANYRAGASNHLIANFSTGYDFLHTFGIKLLQGRDFNRQMDNDTVQRVILNQAAVKELGIDKPVNSFIDTKYLNSLDIKTTRYEIIGVADDFNFKSFHKTIQPIAIFLRTWGPYIAVRIAGGHVTNTIDGIKKAWQRFVPGSPMEYHFLDETIDNLYKNEALLSNILEILTVLIILVAIMGLAGLTLLTVQQRTKEIGIRKVIGASSYNILLIFSKEYIKWVGVAFLLAAPITWLVMQKWLNTFAYRIHVDWWVFPIAGLLAVIITLLVVGMQTIKASNASPVKALKSE